MKVHLLRIQSLGFTERGQKGTFGALQNYICDNPVHLLGAYQKLPKEDHSRLPHHLFSNVNHSLSLIYLFGEGGASCINHISNKTRLNKSKVFPWLKASNATAAKHTLSHLVCHQCATLQIRWHQDCAMTLLWHNQFGTQPGLILQGKKHEKKREGKQNMRCACFN